ncbi:lysophospholipid acyltransferase family protein [Endozoicomonas ascidiicola]|uniref:lysophospholipid acyltransferase family protein n=1 Tax=Endozoicomonas ascidiicola TaxID=1698521 RepID=UPI0024811CAD|nr:lysophospholipid acyltransferase family protein [Endozoicomonas ascidiicola]
MQMFLLRLVAKLPFCLIDPLAWLLYLLVCHVFKYRKGVVTTNIRQAFPQFSEAEVRCLSKRFYRHLTQLFLEMIKAYEMSASEFQTRCTITGQEVLFAETQNQTRPVIILTTHQGNWEWMLHGASLHLDFPIDPVYKPLHHRGMNQFIYEVRSQFNSIPVPMKQVGKNILKQKHFRLFVMLADQRPGSEEQSYPSVFLNKEAKFFTGAERIVKFTQYPVFFAKCKKIRTGYYGLEFIKLSGSDPDSDYPVMDAYIKEAEASIHDQPETYLWSHQRWK